MGKKIIKDDRLVEDSWLLDLAAEGADTAGESAAKNRVVSLEQWQQNRELLLASHGSLLRLWRRRWRRRMVWR